MKETTNLFYEDAKFSKQIYIVLTILLYIVAVIGIISIIIFSIIVPVDSLMHTSITLEKVSINVLFLIMAIIFNVYVARSYKFKYYIEITNDNIKIFIKDKVKIYSTLGFKDYIIVQEHTSYSKFKLQFDSDQLFITTRKQNELKLTLDKIKKFINSSTFN